MVRPDHPFIHPSIHLSIYPVPSIRHPSTRELNTALNAHARSGHYRARLFTFSRCLCAPLFRYFQFIETRFRATHILRTVERLSSWPPVAREFYYSSLPRAHLSIVLMNTVGLTKRPSLSLSLRLFRTRARARSLIIFDARCSENAQRGV